MFYKFLGFVSLFVGVILSIFGLIIFQLIGGFIGLPAILLCLVLIQVDYLSERTEEIPILKRRIENLQDRLYDIGMKAGLNIGLCPNCGGHEPPGTCGYCNTQVCADCLSNHYMNFCRKSPHYVKPDNY